MPYTQADAERDLRAYRRTINVPSFAYGVSAMADYSCIAKRSLPLAIKALKAAWAKLLGRAATIRRLAHDLAEVTRQRDLLCQMLDEEWRRNQPDIPPPDWLVVIEAREEAAGRKSQLNWMPLDEAMKQLRERKESK